MAFAQGGAWVIHGRTGLTRPYRNVQISRERDAALIRQVIACADGRALHHRYPARRRAAGSMLRRKTTVPIELPTVAVKNR
jgi:hypothetical protein